MFNTFGSCFLLAAVSAFAFVFVLWLLERMLDFPFFFLFHRGP